MQYHPQMHRLSETYCDLVVDEQNLSYQGSIVLICPITNPPTSTSHYLCKWISVLGKLVDNVSGHYVCKQVGEVLGGYYIIGRCTCGW